MGKKKIESEKEILTGLIKRRTKGGFVVDIAGVEAFLPESGLSKEELNSELIGQTKEFQTLDMKDHIPMYKWSHVLVTHSKGKVLIEKDLEKQRQEILKNLEKG